ncbi:MAG: heparinase II/III family protein [Pseudomonadota bacterium]
MSKGRGARPGPLWLWGLRRASSSVLTRLFSPALRRPVVGVPSAQTLAPALVATGDAERAEAIYAGHFALAGQQVDVAGHSPFSVPPVSDAWGDALHSFGWLADLNESASRLSSSNARALVDEWLAGGHAHKGADAPHLVAARLTAWLAYAPLLLDGADMPFRKRLMRAVGRHCRQLEKALALRQGDALSLSAALALAGVCSEGIARVRRTGLAALEDALAAAILPDGGHASRSPAAIADALRTLMPVERALIEAQEPVPAWLSGAIDKMLPMLGYFDDGAGGLMDFHGGGAVTPAHVAALIEFGGREVGQAADNARYVGFQRIAASGIVAHLDTGQTPPPDFSARAHGVCLSLHVRAGPQVLIGSCGALDYARPDLADVARSSAAHSALTIADTSVATPSRLWGGRLIGGPSPVAVERRALAVRARHDGYQHRFGMTHERTIRLREDGGALVGVDRLKGSERLAGRPFTVRFHLASTTRVRLERRRRRALLTLGDGMEWLFRVDEGPDIYVEESVVLEGGEVAASKQLVLTGNTLTDAQLRWQVVRQQRKVFDE